MTMDEPQKRRDVWDKLAVILQSGGGLLTAVTVAVLGFLGSNYLKDREIADTASRERMQANEANIRIYTELMSRREEAESALRKDMFVSMIQTFLKPGSGSLDEKVLNLELLSYNFHESLNLKPLFVYIGKQIHASQGPAKKEQLERLHRVATEIARKQMLVLEGAGAKFDRIIDLDSLRKSPGGISVDEASLTLDGITRDFSLVAQEVDAQSGEIKMRLEVRTPKDTLGNVTTNTAEFWVGFFDFPMIDNTRLDHDQRCAVVLNALEESSADITVAFFPGSYASLKEKPYYQEVVQNLMKTNAAFNQEQTKK
jgi:hypothetical protein